MFAIVLLAVLSTAYGRSSRIINGDAADEGQFPWQVSLQSRGGSHFCGGAIIGYGVVLTAAHCVDESGDYQVVVNEHHRFIDHGNEQTLNVDRVKKHPDYGTGDGFSANDIAILFVDDPTGDTVDNAIPLASSGDEFAGQTCDISGWGVTKDDSLSDVLQWTDGKIMSNGECSSSWGSSYNHNSHICIDDRKTGSCNGDSGGPMSCGGVLAGVTSWGRTGCNTRYPSVYTRISNFREWIREETGI